MTGISAADGEPVLLAAQEGPVLTLTLNRPGRLNALDDELLAGLTAAWHGAQDPSVRAVVLTGAGRGFCSGADLRTSGKGDGPRGLRYTFNPAMLAMAALDRPVIAAVNGPAAGAGLALACAADIRIASSAATFVPAFLAVGVAPDMGTSFFLPRILGYPAALRWMLSGRTVGAAEAQAMGLVDEVVESPDALLPRARELAGEIARLAPAAVQATKRLFGSSLGAGLPAQLEAEAELQARVVADPARAAAGAAVVRRLGGQ